jgi:pimeloyl-ACP methyl ester carboxylesterase
VFPVPVIHANDINMFYEISGGGDPLLLIHGLGSSARDWELQVPEFSKKYKVITFDVRGHGRTDKPRGPYSISMFATDAAKLIREMDISPVHVVGISMGGMIAFQLAVSYPSLIKSLVVANCSPELYFKTLGERLQMWQRQLIVRLIGMRKMGEVLSQRLFIKPEQEDIREKFVERWSENDPKAYLASTRALVGWSVVDQLPDIEIPTLVISADEDYPFFGNKEEYASMIPNSEIVEIEDSRHATPAERPAEFNQAVLSFLGKFE